MKKYVFVLLLCAVFTAWGQVVDPFLLGFAPGAPAATNALALQRALDGGRKTVCVTRPGVYGLDRTVWIDNDTRLTFGPGVELRKETNYPAVFSNRGLATRTWNTNIWIEGLSVDANRFGRAYPQTSPALGCRGQLCFYCIRNLSVEDLKIVHLEGLMFGIQVALFENFNLDGFEIRGNKDGVHVDSGRKFVIRNGTLETGDDGIAILAEDWCESGPVVGDIEDGLVENVTDDGNGKCNFARILTGAWVDWHKGIRLQRGDTVRCGKDIYRVVMPLGTNEFISLEQPVHTNGVLWLDSEGHRFWYMKSDGSLQANIRNLTFRNIYMRSPRTGFFANWETNSEWNRGIHPEVKKADYPVCEVSLENLYSESPFPLVYGDESVTIWMRNVTKLRGRLVSFKCNGTDIDVRLHFDGVRLGANDDNGADVFVQGNSAKNRKATLDLTVNGLIQDRDLRLKADSGCIARVNGIGSIASLDNLTPKTGDSIKVKGVPVTFDGKTWK